MKELTCGERFVRALLGEPVDRLPFGVGLGWWPWDQATVRWREELGRPDLEVGTEFGFEPSLVIPEAEFGVYPHFPYEVISEDEEHIIARNRNGILTKNRKDGLSMPEFMDYPIKGRQDWVEFRDKRLDPQAPGRITQDWAAFRARIAQTGEGVQVGVYPWGVFGTPRDFLGAEELLMTFYEDPGLLKEIMNTLTDLWLSVYSRIASEVQIDHIHIWEDMCGRQGSLISPAMVEEFMMPCYDRIVAFARAHDVRLISVDTDGDCNILIPVFERHGINVMFPFEIQAGMDPEDVRRRHPQMGLWGGIDKLALLRGREAIDRELARARRLADAGRYVPMFDHFVVPETPWEAYAYAVEELRKICWEPRG